MTTKKPTAYKKCPGCSGKGQQLKTIGYSESSGGFSSTETCRTSITQLIQCPLCKGVKYFPKEIWERAEKRARNRGYNKQMKDLLMYIGHYEQRLRVAGEAYQKEKSECERVIKAHQKNLDKLSKESLKENEIRHFFIEELGRKKTV